MNMIPVKSSAISKVGYDPDNLQMKILFTEKSTIYTFCSVPQHIFDDLLQANSKGQYYDQHIRDKYQCGPFTNKPKIPIVSVPPVPIASVPKAPLPKTPRIYGNKRR